MFNLTTGTLANTAGITRLTIGVTNKDGKRAAMEFHAANTAAPLFVQDPAARESEDADALLLAGWERDGDLWRDPISGTLYYAANADLVRAGKLTPVRPKVVRGKHAPRVFFDASEVERLIPVSNPSRLSREQSAVRLGVHVRTIDRLVARGTLKAHAAPGGSRRRIEFELSDVDQLREEMNALRR